MSKETANDNHIFLSWLPQVERERQLAEHQELTNQLRGCSDRIADIIDEREGIRARIEKIEAGWTAHYDKSPEDVKKNVER